MGARSIAALCLIEIACGDNTGGPSTEHLTVTVDTSSPGEPIPARFIGVSYETSTLLPDGGVHYFRASNQPLARMMALLGIGSLRIGGNESESGPQPTSTDISEALGFVDAADLELIYTLRLADYDPAAAAATAHAILDATTHLGCFSIGNEGIGITDYPEFETKANAYIAAIGDARAKYCAPDMFSLDWMVMYANQLAPSGAVAAADFHAYYGGNGVIVQGEEARDWLLSPEIVNVYAANLGGFKAQLAPGVRFRLSETNSFFNGGSPGASDTFASALWGLDYLHWWAAHGAVGINLHTGDHVSGATTTYSLFKTSATGYAARPLAYGVKAFELGGRGRPVPVQLGDGAPDDLTAYAVLADGGDAFVTIVNKSHGEHAVTVELAIGAGESTSASVWILDAASDVAATTGVTLGGASITDDGSWAGTAMTVPITQGAATLRLGPASAAIVHLSR